MKLSWPALIIPAIGGLGAAIFVPLASWDQLRPALLPAISIIAAAVLVRLARGLPFTNADHFKLDQFRSVSKNLEDNARKLRALIFVCLADIAMLVLSADAVKLIAPVSTRLPWFPPLASAALSGIIGGLLLYAFTRVVAVVHSDVALLRLQSQILERVIADKNAAAFDARLEKTERPGIAGADKFGNRLPH